MWRITRGNPFRPPEVAGVSKWLTGTGVVILTAVLFSTDPTSADDAPVVKETASVIAADGVNPTATTPARLAYDPFAPHERPRIGPIPEPGTVFLLLAGLGTLLYRSPRRRKRAADHADAHQP